MEQDTMQVEFPGEGGSLVLGFSGYEKPHLTDGPDANWLSGCVTVHAGAFRGWFAAAFTTYELQDFRQELDRALGNSGGVVTLETTEADLSLRVELPEFGDAVISGVAMPASHQYGYLTFRIGTERVALAATLRQLDHLIRVCPVRENPRR